MSKYELMSIVNATLPQDEKESLFKEVTDTVGKFEGKVVNRQVWLDKHKMTFNIKRCTHGTYYLVNFESPTSAINPISQALRMNEKLLRFLILKLDQ